MLGRSRWAALGAAVAVTFGAGAMHVAQATIGAGPRSTYVPIPPCRLIDSRAGETNVGPRSAPLIGGEVALFNVWGANGNCTIPGDAAALQMNVTIANPSADGFLTIWPTDELRPTAASQNWVAAQPPTPNAVTAKLSYSGQFSMFINAGTADVIVDISGYYADHHHDDRYYTKTQIGGVFDYDTGSIQLPVGTYTSGTINCPFGTRAVGTGSRTYGYINYVKTYGTFVGYFLSNQSSGPGEVSAQAVCVQGTAGFSVANSEPVDDDKGASSAAASWARQLHELEIAAANAGLVPAET
jgi:hypothetical protein